MQIKRYRGADMQEALHKVKQELGTDAIILSTRQVRGGGGKFGQRIRDSDHHCWQEAVNDKRRELEELIKHEPKL